MSSLFTSGQSARRLLLLTSARVRPSQHPIPSAPPSIILPHSVQGIKRRQYAIKLNTARPPPTPSSPPPPPTTSASKLSARGVQEEPPRWIFSPADVPPLPEWIHGLESLNNSELSPMQCMEAAQRYVSTATQYESSWRPRLEKDYGLSPYLLHWLGIVLMSANTAPRWRLGTHMLRSASELGYTPSTLTLVRIFTSMSGDMAAKAAKSKIYIEADKRFQQLLNKGTDPDALTLQGLILAKSGGKDRSRRALEAFERAEKAWEVRAGAEGSKPADSGETSSSSSSSSSSSQDTSGGTPNSVSARAEGPGAEEEVSLPPPREPRWEWEISSVLGRAGILQKQGRADEAVALYRLAALELDNPTGFWNLAQLVEGPRDSPERRTYLLKAATSGITAACRELGALEKMVAEREGLSREKREEREKMSREWFRLADGEELKSIQDEAMDDETV
ncbi:hypothetical protein VP1G_06785 [Cytospora mali]|uniref:Uncharacterized protein n=1 Tax=Cytospora mali TaxID=578113 RepID=A0A194V6U6_CYTMA|nr:hypothetical protein VP1G_06785 [Valsa mali var. pyri (nom. inval.)]